MASDLDVKLRIKADAKGVKGELGAVQTGIKGTGDRAEAASKDTDKLGNAFDRAGQSALGLNEILDLAQRFGDQAQAAIELADQYRALEGRIRNTTESQAEANTVMDELTRIALDTHKPLDATAELYARLATNTKDAGFSQQQMLGFTEAINNALTVNGTSAGEASGALLQLSQAMASGALRGEEFNSVNEQMPAVIGALAEHLGVARGELRSMAEQGELTADVVLQATLAMGETWRQQAAALPQTMGKAITDLETSWQRYLGTSDVVAATSEALAEALNLLADNLGQIIDFASSAALAALPALLVKTATAAKGYAASMIAGAAATNKQAAAMANLSGTMKTLNAGFAALVGWEVGKYLSDEFAVVRQAGATMTRAMLIAFENIRTSWEQVQALFTDDTIDAALERHAQRLLEIERNMDATAAQAEIGWEKVKTGANQAGEAATQAGEDIATAWEEGIEVTRELTQEIGNVATAENAAADASVLGAERVADAKRRVIKVDQDLATSARTAGDAGEDAGQRIADSFLTAADAIGRAADRIEQATAQLSRGGVSSGGGTSADYYVSELERVGGEAAAQKFRDALERYIAQRAGLAGQGSLGFQEYLDAVERIGQRTLAAAEREASAQQTATAQPQTATASSSTTQGVRLVFGAGGLDQSVQVTGDTGAFLDQLERAAARSGGGFLPT